jgi:hypothetical protein
MRPWDALTRAMGTSRKRRIGSREAEQLLTADPGASAYPELSHLLAAAAAPPRPGELAGLHPAVAAFEAAGREGRPTVAVPVRRRAIVRSLAVKVTAGVAVLIFGGTALAAETGNLPGGSQRHAHDLFSGLGVPAPGTAPATTAPPSRRPTATPAPIPTPSAGEPSETPGPAGAVAPGLCRSWVARQKNPKKKPMQAESLRKLAAAAGGEGNIAAFCAALLGGDPSQAATTSPGTVAPATSHPGKGKGHTKTPNPHKKG